MSKPTPTAERVINRLMDMVENNELTNEDVVQIIALLGGYLNLQTIPKYSKRSGLTYNGIKHHRNVVQLFGCKLVVDND